MSITNKETDKIKLHSSTSSKIIKIFLKISDYLPLLCYLYHLLQQHSHMDEIVYSSQLKKNMMHETVFKGQQQWKKEVHLPAPSPASILINLPVRFSHMNHLPSSLPLAINSPVVRETQHRCVYVIKMNHFIPWILELKLTQVILCNSFSQFYVKSKI